MFANGIKTDEVLSTLAEYGHISVPRVDELHHQMSAVHNIKTRVLVLKVDDFPVLELLAEVRHEKVLRLLIEDNLTESKLVAHFGLEIDFFKVERAREDLD